MAGITKEERVRAELLACQAKIQLVLDEYGVTLQADGYEDAWVELHKDRNFIKWELGNER